MLNPTTPIRALAIESRPDARDEGVECDFHFTPRLGTESFHALKTIHVGMNIYPLITHTWCH